MRTLSILNGSGDTQLTWDRDNPEECEAARQAVADLASRGYQFFLTDGRPADAVAAGGGTLLVRRLKPEEVVEASGSPPGLAEDLKALGYPVKATEIPATPPVAESPEAGPPQAPAKRRGRPPRAVQANPGETVVAVPALRGG